LIGDYDGMPDLEDLAQDLEDSITELIETAGGRRSIFRRFSAQEEGAEAAARNGGDREESTAG
jgi:hypothetical protein